MANYSEMSTGQIYDKLLESITNQLNGIESSSKVKTLKEIADTRDINLYKNAFDKAISLYNPKIESKSELNQSPKQIEVIKDSLKSTNYKLAQVVGNSMVNKNIVDGEYVMYDQNETMRNGDVIIVKYREQVFIKSYYNSDGSISLKSHNPEFVDIIVEKSEKLEILGKVIMLLKDI